MTALLFGLWKRAVPKPNRASLHITSKGLAEASRLLIKKRATDAVAVPQTAKSLVPMRSDIAPLAGATQRMARGEAVITHPTLSTLKWRTLMR